MAATATLAVRTAVNASSAALTPDHAKRHSASHIKPQNTPQAANRRAGCGPELPIAIGSGGSNSAAPKNAASHRAGLPSVHHAKGTSAAGAASTALAPQPGTTAMAAAHTPTTAAHAHFPRDSGWIATFTDRKST